MALPDVTVRVFRPLWEDMQREFARVVLELGWGPWRVEASCYPSTEVWRVINSEGHMVMLTRCKALAELVAQLPQMLDRTQTESPKHLEE